MKAPMPAPTKSGSSQASGDGTPATTNRPLITASKPISEPTEISILPVTITIVMPSAATAI